MWKVEKGQTPNSVEVCGHKFKVRPVSTVAFFPAMFSCADARVK